MLLKVGTRILNGAQYILPLMVVFLMSHTSWGTRARHPAQGYGTILGKGCWQKVRVNRCISYSLSLIHTPAGIKHALFYFRSNNGHIDLFSVQVTILLGMDLIPVMSGLPLVCFFVAVAYDCMSSQLPILPTILKWRAGVVGRLLLADNVINNNLGYNFTCSFYQWVISERFIGNHIYMGNNCGELMMKTFRYEYNYGPVKGKSFNQAPMPSPVMKHNSPIVFPLPFKTLNQYTYIYLESYC